MFLPIIIEAFQEMLSRIWGLSFFSSMDNLLQITKLMRCEVLPIVKTKNRVVYGV